jgi:hypothetical protein
MTSNAPYPPLTRTTTPFEIKYPISRLPKYVAVPHGLVPVYKPNSYAKPILVPRACVPSDEPSNPPAPCQPSPVKIKFDGDIDIEAQHPAKPGAYSQFEMSPPTSTSTSNSTANSPPTNNARPSFSARALRTVKKCKNVYPRLWRVGIVLVFSCLVVGICFLVAGEYLRLREEREKERMEEFEAGIMNG